MTSKKIVIVGGGVIGLTAAFVLAKRELADEVVLFERESSLGSKSTATAGCGLRTVYRHPVNIDLSRKGLQFWANAVSILGGDIGFRRNGYLFLTDDDNMAGQLDQEAARQVANGVPATYDAPPAQVETAPGLAYDRYGASLFSPTAALASPEKIVDAVAGAAKAEGVELRTDAPVTDLEPTDDGVQVTVDGETERADIVVNAAGAWADAVAGLAGESLPITSDRRRLSVLDASISPEAPLAVDVDTGAYVLPRADGRLYAGGKFRPEPEQVSPDDPAAFTTEFDPAYGDRLRTNGGRLTDLVADATVVDSWTGLYAMTDSRVPIIDRRRNIVHVTGFSGHGIMQAPGAAMVVARLLDPDQTAARPLAALSRDRAVTTPDIQF